MQGSVFVRFIGSITAVLFMCFSGSIAFAAYDTSVYVALSEPCSVGDSRFDNIAGDRVLKDTSVKWDVLGVDLSDQGGDACLSPKPVQPVAALVTVTAVGDDAGGTKNGNLQAYAAGATNTGPTVLFSNANASNTTVVTLGTVPGSEGKIEILVKKNDVPILATVEGFFYPRPAREATVATLGGDYQSITQALADSDSWCIEPSNLNPCKVKVAPGGYLENNIVMKSFITVEGAGLLSSITGDCIDAPIFRFDNAVESVLTNMRVVNLAIFGGDCITSRGIQIENGSAVILKDLEIQVGGGSVGNAGISIGEDNAGSSFVRIEDTNVFSSGPGLSVGIIVQEPTDSLLLTRVNSFADGGGLVVLNSILTQPIAYSTFRGQVVDVQSSNSTITFLNSFFATDQLDLTTGTYLCLNSSSSAGELDENCL